MAKKVTVRITSPVVLDENDVGEVGKLREFDEDRAAALVAEGVAQYPGEEDHPAVTEGAAADRIEQLSGELTEALQTVEAKDDQLDALSSELATAQARIAELEAAAGKTDDAPTVKADDGAPFVIPDGLPDDYEELKAIAAKAGVPHVNVSKVKLTAALEAKRDEAKG